MTDPLAPLLADGVIDEVVARLKTGKEAEVWLVRHRDEILAAKVYKARHARSFKNNAAYTEGRQFRSSRTQRAVARGSRFGQAAAEDAWKAKESDALHRLHAAGVRVPRPVLFYEGVLLMEVVVDASGHPAPRLVDAPLAREQAAGIYAELRRQAVGMLACDLVHGDLSPYNVLVGRDGPVVIDMPQVVDAAQNLQAESFFLRDLQNVHRFLASIDPALRPAEGDGREIWGAYVRRELTADFVPTGRSSEPHRRPSPGGGHRPDARRGGAGPGRPGPRPAAPASGGAPPRSGPAPRDAQGARDGGRDRVRSSRGAHPQSGSPASPASSAGKRRHDPRGRRNGPMPEVIRIDRTLHRAPVPVDGATSSLHRRPAPVAAAPHRDRVPDPVAGATSAHRAPVPAGGSTPLHRAPVPPGGATGPGGGGRRRRRRGRRRPGA